MARTTFSGPVVSTNGFIAGSGSAAITKILTTTAVLDFPSINSLSVSDLSLTITGAAVGDEVILGLPSAPSSGIIFSAFVSSTNNITIRANNATAAPINPASASYGVIIFGAA